MNKFATEKEMPTATTAGKETVQVLAQLNAQAKEMKRKTSVRIRERKEREQEQFMVNISSGGSSSSGDIEEVVVPPTPRKWMVQFK